MHIFKIHLTAMLPSKPELVPDLENWIDDADIPAGLSSIGTTADT